MYDLTAIARLAARPVPRRAPPGRPPRRDHNVVDPRQDVAPLKGAVKHLQRTGVIHVILLDHRGVDTEVDHRHAHRVASAGVGTHPCDARAHHIVERLLCPAPRVGYEGHLRRREVVAHHRAAGIGAVARHGHVFDGDHIAAQHFPCVVGSVECAGQQAGDLHLSRRQGDPFAGVEIVPVHRHPVIRLAADLVQRLFERGGRFHDRDLAALRPGGQGTSREADHRESRNDCFIHRVLFFCLLS